MRNIVLICSAGMSTSMLVKRMQDQANEQGYEATIGAYSVSEVSKVGKDADIIITDEAFNVKQTFVRGNLVYGR